MNKNNRVVTFVIILIFAAIGIYFVVSSRIDVEYAPNNDVEDYYAIPNRKTGVNEYKPASVTEEDMVRTYFNSYVLLLVEDLPRAYAHLSEKSRGFYPNSVAFRVLAANLTSNFTELPQIDRYEISKEKNAEIQTIKVSDTKGHIYVFTVEAVMKYTVDFE